MNTIFKDLATMVHDQGETIDSIEENVGAAAITVHDGTDQLRQAERYKVRFPLKLAVNLVQFSFFFSYSLFSIFRKYLLRFQSKARKKKVCLAVTGIVILAIVIGIIVWVTKK